MSQGCPLIRVLLYEITVWEELLRGCYSLVLVVKSVFLFMNPFTLIFNVPSNLFGGGNVAKLLIECFLHSLGYKYRARQNEMYFFTI